MGRLGFEIRGVVLVVEVGYRWAPYARRGNVGEGLGAHCDFGRDLT